MYWDVSYRSSALSTHVQRRKPKDSGLASVEQRHCGSVELRHDGALHRVSSGRIIRKRVSKTDDIAPALLYSVAQIRDGDAAHLAIVRGHLLRDCSADHGQTVPDPV